MAKNIKVGVKLDKSGFQKELNQLLKGSYDIKLDSSNFKNTINEINKEISKISKNGINISTTIDKNGITSVNKYRDSVAQVTTEVVKNGQVVKQTVSQNIAEFERMKNKMQQKLDGLTNNQFADSNIVKNLQNQLNSLNMKSSVQSANELKKAIDDVVKSSETLQKQSEQRSKQEQDYNNLWQRLLKDRDLKEQQSAQKAIENLDKLKTKLNEKLTTASNNNLIDSSVIDKLKQKLESITTNTPEKEVRELQNTINNLSSADSGIVRLQNAITRLQERIANIRKNKITVDMK